MQQPRVAARKRIACMIIRSQGPRRFVMAAAVALIGAWGAPAAAGDPTTDARQRIQTMWDTVVPILANKGMDAAVREARFGAIYRANFDNGAIAAAVAGAAWQQATPAQRERFLRLFEVYIVKVYAGQFGTYNGEQLQVRASEPDGDGAMVTTRVVEANNGGRPIEIKWRLRMSGAVLKVRDVLVENISMTLHQRREFAAVMQQRGGTLDALSDALGEKIGHLDKRN
jgi:phospholipid transport system substrate-binding protein